MNYKFFGDSFDIVKRFFIGNIREMGYQVFVDPMFTDEWKESEEDKFYGFLEAVRVGRPATSSSKTALFLDPDKGIGRKQTKQNKHVTVEMIVDYLQKHEIVFSFDQSFSRGGNVRTQMQDKLRQLKEKDAAGFYYDSHAHFLFSSKSPEVLENLKDHLVTAGLPEWRLIDYEHT